MKNIQYTIISLLCLLQLGYSFGQVKPLKPVKIGQKVPDLILSGFTDDTSKAIPFKQLYQGKLLILDFWATWCSPCLEALPRVDSLAHKFGDKIVIIDVAYQPYSKIAGLFKYEPKYLPHYSHVMVNDTVLSAHLFPHRSLPHFVWIDSTGTVLAQTDEGEVNADNISKVLQGKKLSVMQKIDNMDFRANNPFHLMDSSFKARSILTGHADGIQSFEVNSGTNPGKPGLHSRKFASNMSLWLLYWMAAYGHHQCYIYNHARIVFELSDSLKFISPRFAPTSFKASKYKTELEWAIDNTYCYELQLPQPVTDSILSAYMMNDLNRYLNLNGRFETRLVDCYVLKSSENAVHLLHSPVYLPANANQTDRLLTINAQPVYKLIDVLNAYIRDGIIIDESGINEPINIDLHKLYQQTDIWTATSINSFLNQFGLTLVKAKRNVSVFVVSENK